MSSADEDSTRLTKKRKLQRACDHCRHKKSDGPQMPHNRCSRCIARRAECTYNEAFSVVSLRLVHSYVENLESRLERMEKLVNKLCPDADLSKELEGSQPAPEASADTPASAASRASSSRREKLSSLSPSVLGLSPQSPVGSDSDEDGDTEEDLTDGLRKLSIDTHPYRFHGRSSGMLLLREAGQIATGSLCGQEKGPYRHEARSRHYSWRMRLPREEPFFDDFPPDDLLDTLVELYFRKVNDMLPLLHEPMFKQSIRDGLHLRNSGFGAIVLLVCANGSRFVRDRRVLLDGSDDWHSAGWRWYEKVEEKQKLELAPAKLYDLQLCVLMAHFLSGSMAPQSTWTLIGNGIRRAIDVGAHRRKVYNANPTIEDELWKRAFWILVATEWTHSYGLGRPSAIHDEDIDVALPTMIDDEHWSSPGQDDIPQQPEGKPSKVAALVSLIRLSQILAFATRTLYPINKSKRTDSSWEQRIVAELDSALNNWVGSLPNHLRWDPNREDPLHLTQSATLLGHYYQVQIAVHRQFLSAAYRDSPLSFPSVIICNNAARSTVQVFEVVHKRLGTIYHGGAGLLYISGAVLMRSIWGQQHSGRTINVDRDIACVRKAIEMLESMQYEYVSVFLFFGSPIDEILAERTSLHQHGTSIYFR
ncbi:fungal-specific transcription factor domain-containing protein [Cerioporus squamosus]|nr:fungal-specific transcription factor domain-containing protein [Cerioporus squamosus]